MTEHADTVREALDYYGDFLPSTDKRKAGLAALDALVAALEQADKDRRTAMGAAERFREQGIKDREQAEQRANEAGETLSRANGLLGECEGILFEGVREDALQVTGCESWQELTDDADEVRWRLLGHLGHAVVDRSEYYAKRLGRAEAAEAQAETYREALREWVRRVEAAGMEAPEVARAALAGESA